MDGLTTNGVLVMHPAGEFVSEPAPGVWREISVCGNVFALRETRSAQQRGKLVRICFNLDNESQVKMFPSYTAEFCLPCWHLWSKHNIDNFFTGHINRKLHLMNEFTEIQHRQCTSTTMVDKSEFSKYDEIYYFSLLLVTY